MPPKRKGGRKERGEKVPEDDEWLRKQSKSMKEQRDLWPRGLKRQEKSLSHHALSRFAEAKYRRKEDPVMQLQNLQEYEPSASSKETYHLSSVRTGNAICHRCTGEGLEAPGYEPQRNTMMILGRPVQALLLSHHRAVQEETEPYLHSKLLPLEPVVLFGREARHEPQCHPEECVYYAWRDRMGTS